MTVASFKDKLADPGAGIQGQRGMSQVHDLQDLVVGDARMHEAGRHMNSQAKTRKPASAFEPAGYIIGEGDFFLRDPQDHLPGFDGDIPAVFDMHIPGYVLEMRVVLDVIDLRPLLEDPEIIAEGKVDRPWPYLRFVERFDGDQFIFYSFFYLFPDKNAHGAFASQSILWFCRTKVDIALLLFVHTWQ